jgi:hypothetical protein
MIDPCYHNDNNTCLIYAVFFIILFVISIVPFVQSLHTLLLTPNIFFRFAEIIASTQGAYMLLPRRKKKTFVLILFISFF